MRNLCNSQEGLFLCYRYTSGLGQGLSGEVGDPSGSLGAFDCLEPCQRAGAWLQLTERERARTIEKEA